MADRTVSVRLRAEIGQYVSGMSRASAATMRLGASATESSSRARSGFDMAGKGALLLGGAVVAGLGMAIGKSMEYEKAMSAAAAATRASGSELDTLREAAMKAGAATQYSATEAAQAITEMGKAGVSTADILNGGLDGALALAAAGQLDVAKAAEIASVAMKQFGLEGDQLPHVADLLAAGAGKAVGSVEDLGMALNQAGLIASAAGLGIEETTAGLSAFAAAGLVGSDAGTSFKTMLQALQAPSGKSAELMAQLGLQLYDTNGNMLGLSEIAGQLQTRLGGLTEEQRNSALATIFGTDAVRAANVLYKEGASGIEQWTRNVDDAGFAQEQAAALTDNLSGDLERLGGAFETLMIQIGGGVDGPLRMLTQGLTGVLDIVGGAIGAFGDLPGPVQLAISAFGAWSIAGDTIMSKLGPLKDSMGGVFGAFGEALTEAKAHGDGLTEVLGSVGEVGWEAAKGGLKELAKAIGPELGMAAATYLIGEFVSGILSVASAGDEAAVGIREMNDEIKGADTNDARFQTINAGLDELKKKAADAKKILDSYNDQNLFDKHVWSGFGEAGELRDARLSLEKYNEQIERLEESNQRAGHTTDTLATKLRLSGGEVAALADKYGIDLTGDLETTQRRFEEMYTKEYGNTPTVAADATGAAMLSAKAQTEEAASALEDWLGTLQEVADGFVDPLAAYKGLLDEKTTAERESAEATAASTESTKDSWKDYVGSVDVSLDELALRLEEQIEAQDNWRRNVAEITQRGGLEVGQIIAAMGEEGVQLAAQMADGTDAEFNRMADLLIQDARRGGAGAAAALDQEMKVMAALGAAGANATAMGIARQLGIGVGEVARIANQYGINLASGISPILVSLGRPEVRPRAGLNVGFSEGGYTGDGHKYEPAGVVHRGEFVVTKERTAKLGVRTLENLERILPGYVRGGFVNPDAVPRPPSLAPKKPPISTAGDATMQHGYDATRAFVQANMEPPPSASGGSSTGLLPIMAAARQYVMDTYGVRNIGGFARRNIAGTNTLSDHAMGKAIDIMTTNLPLGWAIANDFAYGAARGRFRAENVIWQQSISSNGGPFRGMANRGSPTQNHMDHVHVDTYDQGGILRHGRMGINLSGSPERVLNPKETVAYEAGMRSREFSGSGGPGSVTVLKPNLTVKARVFVGNREITDIARIEAETVVETKFGEIADTVHYAGG